MIMVMASLISLLGKRIAQWKFWWLSLAFPALMAVLVYTISNNLSSAVIVLGIAVCMIFVASPDYKKYIVAVIVLAAIAVALWFWAGYMSDNPGAGFRIARLRVWRHPELDPRGTGFQTLQSLYAIGSGGVGGKGLGESIQKLGFLPEAQNDMIFSIVCEELGLIWAIVIMGVYLLLIWRCMFIAHNAPDLFGALLVVGVMSHFAIQVILNIAVVTNTVPNTGISLPFISYGGSSVVFLLIEIGIVLSVSKGIQLREV
jgi:cell division protein FtsW